MVSIVEPVHFVSLNRKVDYAPTSSVICRSSETFYEFGLDLERNSLMLKNFVYNAV